MTRRVIGGRAAAVVLLACVAVVGCRARPQPTYEYEQTETTITTTPPPGRAVTTTLPPKGSTWKRGEAR